MAWTRIAHTPLGIAAKAVCQSNPRRYYHNWDHVGRLYFHAEHTYGMAYDADLDRAIATHDVIIDAFGDLEMRSSQWLSIMAPNESPAANEMIERTYDHKVIPGGDNRIVLLDLADLAVPELVVPNRINIRRETHALKGTDDHGFAHGNLAYFKVLHANFSEEFLGQLDAWEAEAFRAVRIGIETVMEICRSEIAAADGVAGVRSLETAS
jgi:hypothetical protein